MWMLKGAPHALLLPLAAAFLAQPILAVPTLTLFGRMPPTPLTLQTSVMTETNCLGPGAVRIAARCVDTAFISTQLATTTSTFVSPNTFNFSTAAPTNQTFTSTFNRAVMTQPSLAGWTIMNGGTLDLTINIDTFRANLVSKQVGPTRLERRISSHVDIEDRSARVAPATRRAITVSARVGGCHPDDLRQNAASHAAPIKREDTDQLPGARRQAGRPQVCRYSLRLYPACDRYLDIRLAGHI